MDRFKIPFLTILFTIIWTIDSFAAILSPDLMDTLKTLTPDKDVSVIITLLDKVDVKNITVAVPNNNPKNGRALKRKAIVDALKAKANMTQGSLKTLLLGRAGKRIKPLWITNSIAVTVPASVISELMSLPQIESIELDAVIQAPHIVPAAASTPEWNITQINAPTLWNAGITGTGVVVANLDTGVDVTHPDLQSRWLGTGTGCDIAVPPNCSSYWFDPYTTSTLPYSSPISGHGTGTMGILVGGSASSAYGVAPGAQWIAAKIFNDSGSADNSEIAQALQWLVAPGGNASNAPDIVNNSWGFNNRPNQCVNIPLLPPLPTTLEVAIQNVQAAGIAVVFSAGNNGPNPSTSVSPANYPGIFAVGATDFNNHIAFFSSMGPSPCIDRTTSFPNVVAPGTKDNFLGGVGIYTAAPVSSGSYQSLQGTSFSAPHVAGAMALLLSAFPALTPAQMETALEQSALGLIDVAPNNTVPNNVYGYGLIDVGGTAALPGGALSYITKHGDIAIPEIAGYPASFDYGTVGLLGAPVSQTFTIANRSAGSITINSLSISGADSSEFSIPPSPSDTCTAAVLLPSSNCTFVVTLTPSSIGSKSAQISIDYGSPAVVVLLSGNVFGPVARVQDATIVATYLDIHSAYTDSVTNDIIELQASPFTESPTFDSSSNISIGLQGGYNTVFGSQAGFTTVTGTITIISGAVTVGNVMLQ